MPLSGLTRLCILVLAVEWLFFGSCHFTFREATEAQLPGFIPFKTFVVVSTGMIEVATGTLILLPKTRRWAARTSIVLLILFLPAVYNILAHDEAIRGSMAWRNFFRLILVPNHVLLALSAIHLWHARGAPIITPAPVRKDVLKRRSGTAMQSTSLVVALVMMVANLAGLLAIWTSDWHYATAVLWAMMCLSVGALVGFLFGVPRVSLGSSQLITHSPNSNIEVVSDWLTKIIVGVGLLEFRQVGGFVNSLSVELGTALALHQSIRGERESAAFAQALIVYFFFAGLVQGYLLTRIYLSRRFAEHESPRPSTGKLDKRG